MTEYTLADSLLHQVQMYVEVRLQLQLLYHIEQLAQIANVMITEILISRSFRFYLKISKRIPVIL